MRVSSILAFAGMVGGLAVLIAHDAIFATRPVTIAIQAAAVLLMIYARVTFGRRKIGRAHV